MTTMIPSIQASTRNYLCTQVVRVLSDTHVKLKALVANHASLIHQALTPSPTFLSMAKTG